MNDTTQTSAPVAPIATTHESLLTQIWDDILSVFGILQAAAPAIAVSDPGAAAAITKADATVSLVAPLVNAVSNQSPVALTPEQTVSNVATIVANAANVAAGLGAISTSQDVLVNALAPAIATAVNNNAAANSPAPVESITVPVTQVRG